MNLMRYFLTLGDFINKIFSLSEMDRIICMKSFLISDHLSNLSNMLRIKSEFSSYPS
jgi:hypothetical protein